MCMCVSVFETERVRVLQVANSYAGLLGLMMRADVRVAHEY